MPLGKQVGCVRHGMVILFSQKATQFLMVETSDLGQAIDARGMLHCKPEIVGAHPCSGDYTLIHHCNLNNDFIQKKKGAAGMLCQLVLVVRSMCSAQWSSYLYCLRVRSMYSAQCSS